MECQCHSKKTKFQKCQRDEIEGNNIRTKQNEGYHQESLSNRSGQTKNSKTNGNQLNMKGSEANFVDKFTKLIMEGPVNICIICNRCLHTRTVLAFIKRSMTLIWTKFFVILCNRRIFVKLMIAI